MPSNDHITCKVFLGFGGSGAKTLLELARMFAADKEWAQRCEMEAYFLLADTDADDLYQFERQIRNTLADVGAHVWVKSIQLSEGVPRMDRLISDRLAPARKSDKAMQRLRSAWWFDADDRPFIARNVQLPPSEGACQCPAISYFLAWNAIGSDASPVGRTIEEMCREMHSRVAIHKGARDFDVKLYLVAGLAGGTGRGSWATLSFAIQQALQNRGKVAFPIGVFFDQSCFADVAESTQGQRVKMVINSLTGISEVAGWLENDLDRAARKGQSGRFVFRLPSFSSPERDSSDVIDAGRLVAEDGQAGATPVRQAFLIFADSPAGRLASGAHYKVAAAALYARTSQSAIESEQSNTRLNIGSLGAASVRIDVDSIREYLRRRMECDLIGRFAGLGGAGSKADQKQIAADAEAIASAVLLPLVVDGVADKGRRVADDGADRNQPQLLARLHKALLASVSGRIGEFVDGLESMSASEYADEVKKLAAAATKGDDFVKKVGAAIQESIQHVFGETLPQLEGDPAQYFAAHVQAAMRNRLPSPSEKGRSLDAHLYSFAVAQAVLARLAKQCSQIDEALAGIKQSVKLDQVVEAIRKRSGKKLLVVGKRFSEDEKEAIRAELEQFVLGEGRAAIAKLFEKWVEPLRRLVASWEQNLEDAKELTYRHADAVAKLVDEDRTDDLFTVDADFKRAERQVPTTGSHEPERFLQPYATEEQFAEWRRELLAQRDDRMQEALAGISQYVLANAYGTDGGGKQDDEQKKRLRRELQRRLDEFHRAIVVPAAFLHKHFRLADVAERLVAAWATRIDKAASNPRGQENLKKRFSRLFGFDPKERGGQCEVPDKKEIIELMGTRLGQNCRAQYTVRGGSGKVRESLSTHVFLPTDSTLVKGATPLKEWRSKLNRIGNSVGNVKFCVDLEGDEEGGEGRGNPFALIAVIVEGLTCETSDSDPAEGGTVHDAFERISSLDYWRAQNDPHVKTFLDWIEDPNGRSMFADVSYSFGLGYTLPAFVTDDRLRLARWRPWAKAAETRLERQGSAAVDAIAYALLGTPKSASVLYKLSVQDQDGQKTAWTLPLLRFGGSKETKNGFVFLRAAFTDQTGDWRAKGRAFSAGDEESSIKKLMARFADDAELLRAVRAEAVHFFGTLAFEEGIRERDVQKEFVALHDWVEDVLRGELKKLTNYEVDYADLVERLADRALALSKMSRNDLAELYAN